MDAETPLLALAIILFVAGVLAVVVGMAINDRLEEARMRWQYDEIQRRIDQQIAAECYGAAHKQDHMADELDFDRIADALNRRESDG